MRENRFPIPLGILVGLCIALPAEAANDPRDLASQNAKDASVIESTGQAYFRIEIPAPKGTGGSEPELALTYSSNLSDGAFGVGWGVELGEIRRAARFGTPAYDSTDAFDFDGVLLVEDAANPGEYRTYQESFARITRSVNGIDDQWLVEFPDGRKARFGMDQTTRIRRGGSQDPETDSGEIGRWLLSELEDVNGNITRFTYDRATDIGTAYPRRVEYSYRDGSEAPVGGTRMKKRIQFILEDRTDEFGRDEVIYGFPLGIETRIGKRVREIQSFVGNDVYRRLILTYAPSAGHDTGRSRLETAQLFGAYCQPNLDPIAKCQGLPAKSFRYTNSDALGTGIGAQWDPNATWHGCDPAAWQGCDSLHFTQGEEGAQGRDRGVRIGDINGDGYPDYVQAWRKARPDGFWDAQHEVYLNDGSGWGTLAADWKAELEALRVTAGIVKENRPDASARETCSTENYVPPGDDYVFFRAENPFNYENAFVQQSYKLISAVGEAKLVDLNGDGFSDIVISFEMGAGSSTADSRCGPDSWDAPIVVKQVFVNNGITGPADGGGWTDKTAEWADSLPPFYSIYLRSDGGSGTESAGIAWTPGKWRGNLDNPGNHPENGVTYAHFFDHGVRMADLNGDGRPDIIARRDPVTFGSGSAVVSFESGVWLSDPDGTGWVRDYDYGLQYDYDLPVSIVAEFNFYSGFRKYVHDADAGVRFADVNGDGLADLIKTSVDPIAGHGPLADALMAGGVWLNTGSGWCGESSGNPECAAAQKYLPPADFTTISVVYQPPAPTWEGGNLALVRSSELAFVDLNGDGLVDLLKTDSADLTGLNAWIHDPSDPGIWVQDGRYVPDDLMATTGRWLEGGNLYIFDNGVRIFDYNGDATIDFMKDRLQTPSAPRAIHLSRSAHVDLLESFDNGQGGVQTLEYTSAIKQRDDDFETAAKNQAGPDDADEADSIGLPRWTARSIVSRITTADTLPGGSTHSTTLIYAMPQWDPDTRTLLGFRGVRSIYEDGDAIDGNEPSELTYFWQQPGRIGRPNRITTYAGAEIFRERVMTWEAVPGSPEEGSIPGVKIGRLTGERQANHYAGASGSTQEAIYEYTDGVNRGYNFIYQIASSRPTGNLIVRRVPDETHAGGRWIKGRLASETYEDSGSEILKQTDYGYDARGLPTFVTSSIKQRYASATPTPATTAYLFDEFGNLIRIRDPENRTTYFCYDGDTNYAEASGGSCRDAMGTDTHSVVVSVKDPLGEETGFSGSSIDLAGGRLTSVDRIYSGDSDWIDVDAFNRPTQRWTKPDGQNQNFILATREYVDDPAAQDNDAGRPYVVERSYFDKMSAVNDAATVRTAKYVDGMGRGMVSVFPVAPLAPYPFGRSITARDYAGRPTRATLAIPCADPDCTNLPEATHSNDLTVAEINQSYDALGRVLTRRTPDGVVAFAYGRVDFTPPPVLGWGASVPLDVVLSKDANGVFAEHLFDGDRLVMASECEEVDPDLEDLSDVSCLNPSSTFYTYEATGEVESIYDATENYGSLAHRLTYRYDTLGRVLSIEDPDGGVTVLTYDKVGNLTQTENTSIGSTTRVNFEYDELDRLEERNTPNQPGDWDLSVTYDPKSRKRATVSSSGSYHESWEYDEFGNLKMSQRTMNQRTLRTDFAYDLVGRLVWIQSPLGPAEGVSYGYIGAYLTRVCARLDLSECEDTPSQYYVDDVQYDALGRPVAISEAPGELKFAYYTMTDDDEMVGRAVQQVKWMKLDDDGSRLNLGYQYNNGGQVIHIADSQTVDALRATASYDYDQRGRLLAWTAAHHDNVPKYFTYDRLGNLVGRDVDAPGDENQFYADPDRPHAITRSVHAGKSYEYDARGSVTRRGDGEDDEYITYNSLGQVYCVGSSQNTCSTFFWYDIDGNLLSKTRGTTSEIYLGDYFRFDAGSNTAWTYTSAFGRQIVMQKKTVVSLRAAWAPPTWPLPIERALLLRLLAGAGLMGMLALLAWLGAIGTIGERPATASVALALVAIIVAPPQAWGLKRGGGGGGGSGSGANTYTRFLFHDHLGSNALALDPGGIVLERRIFGPFGAVVASQLNGPASVQTSFTGKRYHDELDLYNFGARWYDPEVGRFVSVDPIVQSVMDPQTHNPYTYARNNPIGYVDPDGLGVEESSGGGGQAVVWFLADALNAFFGGGDANPAGPPPTPNGPPASGHTVAVGNTVSGGDEVTASTAMKYGSESRGGLAAAPAPSQPNEPAPTDVPRWPEFFSINVNVAIPNPWTGTLVGGTGAVTVDENGDVYVGVGPSVGKTLPFVSGSAAFGWLNQQAAPTEGQLRSFLTGHGFNASAGFWGGGAINYSPGTGTTATSLGLFTPQVGGGYTYSWHVGDLWQ